MDSLLPRRVKVGYGAADLGISGALLLVQLYLFEFYTRVVGMSPGLVGGAVALAIIWDAVSDPLMGVICDRTRTRLGRFLPYLMGGGVALPLSLILLFNPPELSTDGGRFLYLLGSYMLLNTALTVIAVPHLALGGAITANTDERTEVFGWRLIFGTVGLLVGVAAPLIIAEMGAHDTATDGGLEATRRDGSVLVAAVFVVFTGWTVWATWRYGRNVAGKPATGWSGLWRGFGEVMGNRLFRPILLSFFLVSLGRAMNGILALPFYKYSLRLSEADVQRWVLGLFAVCIALSVVVWLKLSQRFGKKWPGFAGMLVVGVMTMVAYPLFPQGLLWGPLGAAVVGGIAVGSVILFESMVTDVADEDRLRTGTAREGVYFGFWRLGQKLSSSLGVLLTSFALQAIGYQEGVAVQTESVERGLAWLFGPGVGVFFVGGALCFAWSPLTFERQKAIQAEIGKREDGESV